MLLALTASVEHSICDGIEKSLQDLLVHVRLFAAGQGLLLTSRQCSSVG